MMLFLLIETKKLSSEFLKTNPSSEVLYALMQQTFALQFLKVSLVFHEFVKNTLTQETKACM